MPFEIKIRQTGIFRTRLKIERLNTVSCVIGMHDRFQRFTDMIPSEGYLIIYDPEHIGTGVRMRYAEDETEETVLSVPGVTTKYDIELLMNLTAAVMKKWHTRTIEYDGFRYKRDALSELGEILCAKSRKVLSEIHSDYDNELRLVHGALWPLVFETDQIRSYAKEDEWEKFASLLHECQSRNLYWCACHVFLDDDQKNYQGVMTITCGIDTIIPLKPAPPVDMIDPVSGDAIECRKYLARIVTGPNRRPILQMEYHKFLEMIHAWEMPLYDARHVVYHADEEKLLKEAERQEEMGGKPCW
jgi:hypothetical protein